MIDYKAEGIGKEVRIGVSDSNLASQIALTIAMDFFIITAHLGNDVTFRWPTTPPIKSHEEISDLLNKIKEREPSATIVFS